MPKQIYKIDRFEGGLSTNSDPRDISPNELSKCQDAMVDEFGKIRTMGGSADHKSNGNIKSGFEGTISNGYGLFSFSHDFKGGEDAGSSEAETGDNYLALYDDNDQQIHIYSESVDDGGASGWDDDVNNIGSGVIDIGSTSGAQPCFYMVDGNIRVSDGNFGANNRVKWYGYINRYFYGDGVTGYDANTSGTDASNGLLISKWYSGNANLEPLPIKSFFGYTVGSYPDASNPISIDLDVGAASGSGSEYQSVSGSGAGALSSGVVNFVAKVDFTNPSGGGLLTNDNGSSTNPGYNNIISVGDYIYISSAANAGNDDDIFRVKEVTATTIKVEESLTAATADTIHISIISKSSWFESPDDSFEVAASTLYDDSKQESELSIFSTAIGWSDIGNQLDGNDFKNIKMDVHVYTGLTDGGSDAGDGLHDNHPRVSGFKIYMRRANTKRWYLQTEIDITKGNRWFEEGVYSMWENDSEMGTTTAHCDGESRDSMRQIETYRDETGFAPDDSNLGFNANGLGFKTAVVANRRAYIGNVKIKDKNGVTQVLKDSILVSGVNSFDKFSYDNRIELSVGDGAEIVKLEYYADRLLEFKQNKLTILNISQDLIFVEDTYMYKGVSHVASVTKTDFGIAWVNEFGCFLYDGKQVVNLLEKQGMRLIKESDWDKFLRADKSATGARLVPMLGYLPRKRQLIVYDDIGNASSADPRVYLYDLLTQSWVTGTHDNTNRSVDAAKTNFVNDWDGNLVYGHTNTSDVTEILQWDDTSDGTNGTSLDIATADVDFDAPGIRKKLCSVIITYKCTNDSGVRVRWLKDGASTSSTPADFSATTSTNYGSSTLDDSSGEWQTATLIPDNSDESKEIKSIRILIDDTASVPADFEINDISIVYRPKPIK